MKRFIFLLLIIGWAACGNEPAEQVANEEVTPTTLVNTKTYKETTKKDNPNIPVGSIGIAVESKTASAGNEICLSISVSSFSKMLSTQYTVSWDTEVLNFSQVKDFKLPYMSQQSFGRNHTSKGKLTSVWIDNSLSGVTLEDGSKIYDICFLPKSNASGKSSAIEFSEEPTPFESVNIEERVLSIVPTNGKITVK